MLLTLTTTHEPATDIGFLLHKNPASVRSLDLWFGSAHVFYPEAGERRATAAVLLEVDPVGLTRRGRGHGRAAGPPLAPYVNDRPYVVSSFMSVALAKLFGTAMSGRSKDRPELADTPLPLEVRLPVLPCRGGEPLLRELFEPLGYEVVARPIPLDDRFPEWGASPYADVTLRTTARVADVLTHLYVLLPVLDDSKHYWVSNDEIDKLLHRGGAWLRDHPRQELITRRYLRHQGRLAREALTRLLEGEQGDPELAADRQERAEERIERPLRLGEQRIDAVLEVLRDVNASRVLDLGCGEGRLLETLLRGGGFEEVTGVDVSYGALERAARRLRLEEMTPKQRERVSLVHSSLTYTDQRLAGYDAAAALEVVEHLDPARLPAFERVLFGHHRPDTVVVTTPNAEYNVRFEGLREGGFRNADHRFEWTRAQFREWAATAGDRYGYAVRHAGVGPADTQLGAPTQMAVFTR